MKDLGIAVKLYGIMLVEFLLCLIILETAEDPSPVVLGLMGAHALLIITPAANKWLKGADNRLKVIVIILFLNALTLGALLYVKNHEIFNQNDNHLRMRDDNLDLLSIHPGNVPGSQYNPILGSSNCYHSNVLHDPGVCSLPDVSVATRR